MSTEVGNIHYTLDLDDKKFSAGLNRSVDASKEFTKGFLVAGAAIGAAAVGFAAKSVQAFQESETAMAQLEAVIESTGNVADVSSKQMAAYAQHLQNMTGVSD